MADKQQFMHHGEPRWLSLTDRDDGKRWYTVFRLNPDREIGEPAHPNRYVEIGSIWWGLGRHGCEGPDGSPASGALCTDLLLALESAKDAGIIG